MKGPLTVALGAFKAVYISPYFRPTKNTEIKMAFISHSTYYSS